MKNLDPQLLLLSLQALITVLLALLGFTATRLVRTLDETNKAQLALNEKLSFLRAHVEFMQLSIKDMPRLAEDVAVLKRDLLTAWKHIDSLTSSLTRKP